MPTHHKRERGQVDNQQVESPIESEASLGGGGSNAAAARRAWQARAARAGMSQGATALAHAGEIQRSFGHHDVTGVRAHVGGASANACAELGAEAYAYGGNVAFRQSPDLHTAAHEAAHVVQQNAGVQCRSSEADANDPLEQHADAVADRVVAGESSQGLLDEVARGPTTARDVATPTAETPAPSEADGSAEMEANEARAAGDMSAVDAEISEQELAVEPSVEDTHEDEDEDEDGGDLIELGPDGESGHSIEEEQGEEEEEEEEGAQRQEPEPANAMGDTAPQSDADADADGPAEAIGQALVVKLPDYQAEDAEPERESTEPELERKPTEETDVQLKTTDPAKKAMLIGQAELLAAQATTVLGTTGTTGALLESKFKQLDVIVPELKSMQWKLIRAGIRTNTEVRISRLHSKCVIARTRAYGRFRRTAAYKRYQSDKQRAARRRQRAEIQNIRSTETRAKPIFDQLSIADGLLARAGRVRGGRGDAAAPGLSQKHRLADVAVTQGDQTISTAEKAEYLRHAAGEVGRRANAEKRQTARVVQLTALRLRIGRARSGLVRTTRNLSAVSAAHRNQVSRVLRARIDLLRLAHERLTSQIYRAKFVLRDKRRALADARAAMDPSSRAGRAAMQRVIKDKRRQSFAAMKLPDLKRTVGHILEQKGYPSWARDVIVKYTGLRYDDTSKWGKTWSKKRYSQEWRKTDMPNIIQAMCDQIAEIAARHRGLKTITPGLTGQTRWYMKEAAKAKAAAKAAAKAGAPPTADQVASFGPVTKNNVKPGSALFFMGWSGSANQWQVAANREGFEPTYSSVDQAQPITSNTNTYSDGTYEYWRIDPMSPGDLPTKFSTALRGHDALVKMGCWVRFPKAMVATANQTSVQTLYIQPEFLKWSHVATVVKVEPGIAMCFETGGGPARLNPRAISRLVGDPAVYVGYKK